MKRFVPREKLGKKAHKQLDSEQRTTWTFLQLRRRSRAKNCTTASKNPMTVMMITAWDFVCCENE